MLALLSLDYYWFPTIRICVFLKLDINSGWFSGLDKWFIFVLQFNVSFLHLAFSSESRSPHYHHPSPSPSPSQFFRSVFWHRYEKIIWHWPQKCTLFSCFIIYPCQWASQWVNDSFRFLRMLLHRPSLVHSFDFFHTCRSVPTSPDVLLWNTELSKSSDTPITQLSEKNCFPIFWNFSQSLWHLVCNMVESHTRTFLFRNYLEKTIRQARAQYPQHFQ